MRARRGSDPACAEIVCKSDVGIASEDPVDRQNIVEKSFSQYVVESDQPLIVGERGVPLSGQVSGSSVWWTSAAAR